MSAPDPKARKLEELRLRKARIEAQIRRAELCQAAAKRKRETRLKILIGAALLADCRKHPETAVIAREAILRAITNRKDQQFLHTIGWFQKE